MVERFVRNEEARGSNPLTSTNFASAKFKRLSGDYEWSRGDASDMGGRAERPTERERRSQRSSTGGARSAGFKSRPLRDHFPEAQRSKPIPWGI